MNGIASGSSSSTITLVYPTLSPVFSAPMGCSGISCPACSLRLFYSFLVSSTHVSSTPSLCSLSFIGGDVSYAAPFPPDFSSNNPTSSAFARGNELPVFHQRVNCFLTVSLAPSHYPPHRFVTEFYVSCGPLNTSAGFPFPVSGFRICSLNTWSHQYPQYGTVKSYLCAIRSLHTELCHGDPLFASPCSVYVLRSQSL